MDKKSNRNETDIKGHTRDGKILNPPFLSKGFNMSTSSWYDKRLPEMLWAVLVIGNIERDIALDFFRYIGESTTKYLSKYVKISAKHKKEVITFEFDKEKAESMNKKLGEFKAPSYPIIGAVILLHGEY